MKVLSMPSFLFLLLSFLFLSPHEAMAKPKAYDLPTPDSYRVFNLGPGCRFKLKMSGLMRSTARYDNRYPFGAGGLGIAGLRSPQDHWGLNFRCDQSSDDFVTAGWATLNNNKWRINENEDNRKLLSLHALFFHDLKTMGANGWAITFDETYGEEKFRQRTLVFCIVRVHKSVCGTSDVGYLQSIRTNRKADFTSYAIRLLQTVEFMDDLMPEGGNGTEWDSLKTDQTPP